MDSQLDLMEGMGAPQQLSHNQNHPCHRPPLCCYHKTGR